MNALDLLLTRQSTPRLAAPEPTQEQLEVILNAGARVPDHAGLTPWEFIIAQGEGLDKLGNIFSQAAERKGCDEAFIEKAQNMPKRAPMVITVVAKIQQHQKVPVLEQQISAGCAVMAMQQAAFAQGLGGIWRTGALAFNSDVNQLLGLSSDDQIVGFLYLGSPVLKAPVKAIKSGQLHARYL
ncbi:NAD(P)H nitroreductase [Shewanella surugensis]|uniref:Putative NAD(P)H nitroreductase n=1 Tax=Shewanella surugensis TaxID=212020 RepID=A0ABT0L7J9_9GAMM|nr:NAD(P)H nitroreductase [Shewanella surugensis]MCL1123662.1 NAD(P)H nitroreductase [Shewanella surugensis]